MHRLADDVVATEGEGDVADATADAGERQILFNPFGGADEVDRVVVVFFDAGGDGEDVWVEDNVLSGKADLPGENAVGTLANLDLAFESIGLTALIESHDDNCG